jgi:hypothetical protein
MPQSDDEPRRRADLARGGGLPPRRQRLCGAFPAQGRVSAGTYHDRGREGDEAIGVRDLLRGPLARLLPVSAAGRRDAVRRGTTEPRRYAAGGRWRRERAMERSEGGVDLPRRCARRLGVVPPACAIMEAVPGQRRIARVQRAITRPMFASPPTRRPSRVPGQASRGRLGGRTWPDARCPSGGGVNRFYARGRCGGPHPGQRDLRRPWAGRPRCERTDRAA